MSLFRRIKEKYHGYPNKKQYYENIVKIQQ